MGSPQPRSAAKPTFFLCGKRFLRGLLLDIRWEYLNRSVAKRAILLRGRRFLRGLLLDIRWDPVNRSAAYFHYGPRWLPGFRWCNAATGCCSTIGYFLKNSSLGQISLWIDTSPWEADLYEKINNTSIRSTEPRVLAKARRPMNFEEKKRKLWAEPPQLEFSTVRGLFYIKKIQRVKQRFRHRKLQSAIENSF